MALRHTATTATATAAAVWTDPDRSLRGERCDRGGTRAYRLDPEAVAMLIDKFLSGFETAVELRLGEKRAAQLQDFVSLLQFLAWGRQRGVRDGGRFAVLGAASHSGGIVWQQTGRKNREIAREAFRPWLRSK